MVEALFSSLLRGLNRFISNLASVGRYNELNKSIPIQLLHHVI